MFTFFMDRQCLLWNYNEAGSHKTANHLGPDKVVYSPLDYVGVATSLAGTYCNTHKKTTVDRIPGYAVEFKISWSLSIIWTTPFTKDISKLCHWWDACKEEGRKLNIVMKV